MQAGVEVDKDSGAIKVDDFSRSSVPSIWAIGDVTDRIALTPVALMEGMAFAKNAFGCASDAVELSSLHQQGTENVPTDAQASAAQHTYSVLHSSAPLPLPLTVPSAVGCRFRQIAHIPVRSTLKIDGCAKCVSAGTLVQLSAEGSAVCTRTCFLLVQCPSCQLKQSSRRGPYVKLMFLQVILSSQPFCRVVHNSSAMLHAIGGSTGHDVQAQQ